MSIFKFKQFEVDQSGCAMKINTDGVLIGARATHPDPHHILDIGTGTGVIALMLAQRFPEAAVEAVEIDLGAAEAAKRNFSHATFKHRLQVHHTAIAEFNTSGRFDLIVSNPPFFVNDMKSEEKRKEIARHADEVFFADLVTKVNDLLTDDGRFWLILPIKQANDVISLSLQHHLHLSERINLRSDQSKPTFRQIICLERYPQKHTESDFFIYETPKVHTADYQLLLKDFFLAY